ncbi:MAG: HDOD domain-containing protein [Gammaproteobacteria bacterium]|nr:HDOD domain-containing protein [Gammaproteobacteria bacterium]
MSVSGLFTKIYRDIVNDQVNLIRLPDVVVRLRKTLSEQDVTIDIVARVIQTDVGASAYLLNIGNSPAYRSRVKASDIQSAIRMMGIPTFSSLIMAYAVKSLVTSKNPVTLRYMKSHWQKSAYRAAIASAIAKMTDRVDPGKALLAGLLQDVGALPILTKLQTDQLDNLTAEEIELALATYAGKVGVVLAEKWELDEDFRAVIKNARNLTYDGGDKTDLVDVVNIARLLSHIGEPGMTWPRLEETPCLMKFGEAGLTMETSLALLKQAQDDINEIKRVLSA